MASAGLRGELFLVDMEVRTWGTWTWRCDLWGHGHADVILGDIPTCVVRRKYCVDLWLGVDSLAKVTRWHSAGVVLACMT